MTSSNNRTQVQRQQTGSIEVRKLLSADAYKARFDQVLGANAPQYMASIVNLSRDVNLATCEPESIIAAAFVAATLDLPIDKNLGVAWIVPYDINEKDGNNWISRRLAQMQLGYRAYTQLALRTGEYSGMNAVAVNAEALGRKNRSGIVELFNDIGEIQINWEQIDETKEAVGYAFAWALNSGFRKVVYWPKDKVEGHARRFSKAYQYDIRDKKQKSPWSTDYDAMAIKTVSKNSLSKWGILSVTRSSQFQTAMMYDQSVQSTIDGGPLYPDNPNNDDNGGDKPGNVDGGNGTKAEAISQDQREALVELAKQHECPNDKLAEIVAGFGFQGMFQITDDRFDEVCAGVIAWKTAPVQNAASQTTAPATDQGSDPGDQIRTEQRNKIERYTVLLLEVGLEKKDVQNLLKEETGVTTVGRIPNAKLANALTRMQREYENKGGRATV